MIKNFNYILIFLLTLSSCSNLDKKKPLNEFSTQDSTMLQTENKIGIIDLDSVINFSGLRKRMGELTCEGKTSRLRIKLNDTLYHITGFSNCPTSHETDCYFRRNVISIRNDSLIIGFGAGKVKKPISYLKTELENIMSKTSNFQYNENKVNPALFYFYVEDKYPISTTKKVLKEIVEQFSLIHSKNNPEYFKYNIHFNGFDISNIPPPPPPPKQNKFER